AAGGGDCTADSKDARAGDPAFVHCTLDAEVAIAGAFGLQIADGGETPFESAPCRDRSPRSAIRLAELEQLYVVAAELRVFALQEHVRVRVGQAGKYRGARQVNQLDILQVRRLAGDAFNAVVADDDVLVLARLGGDAINQRRGVDDDDVVRLGGRG